MPNQFALYIWRDGKSRYEEVHHLPETEDEDARSVANITLCMDQRATRVQLEDGAANCLLTLEKNLGLGVIRHLVG